MKKDKRKKINNPVAKHCRTFNKAHVFKDRTKYDRKRDKRIILDK